MKPRPALLLLATAALLQACAPAGDVYTGGTPASFVYSPYKYVAIGRTSGTDVIGLALTGTAVPLVIAGRSTLPASLTALTLAFATGECGDEAWEGVDGQAFADANVRTLADAGIGYIVSTGGQAAGFTCASDEGMERFVARYASPRLIGFDFDIERGQSQPTIDALVRRIASAKARHPRLRISFTLATWAATDGSRASLNADGERVMRAIAAAGLADYYVNLMVMDFGDATPRNCVVAGAVCDMGRSALQAAGNLHAGHGVPLSRIELTPMIGVNDVVSNVFTLADAVTLARFVRERGLAGVHFWSLDRDAPCARSAAGAAAECHGIAARALAFTDAFGKALGR